MADNVKVPSAGITSEYPAYVPSEPKQKNRLVNTLGGAFDWVAGYSGLLVQAWVAIAFSMLAVHMVCAHLLRVETPGFVGGVVLVVVVPVVAVLLGLLAIGIVVGPVVAVGVLVMLVRDRNKTDLDIFEVNHVARSLASVGISDARDLVLANPLQAEAYERVSRKVRQIAHQQHMSHKEAEHHAHWLGMLMYPGTAELEREVPLMRVLEDRGVIDANAALAAVNEPQYSLFAVTVTDEEIAASKEAVRSFDGDIMVAIDLEEKIRTEGYKPTSDERKLIKGSHKYYGDFTAHAAISVFSIVTLLGIAGTVAIVVASVSNGTMDASAAVLWSLVGAYFSVGVGSVMTVMTGDAL